MKPLFGVDDAGFLTYDGREFTRQKTADTFQHFRCGEIHYSRRRGEHDFSPAIRDTGLLADALNDLITGAADGVIR